MSQPDLGGCEAELVAAAVRSTFVSSTGAFLDAFEARIAAEVGVRHAIATCNGTAALHLALCACGVGPGDEVIVPSLAFVAVANAVTYCGATPVFADVEPDTWCLSPASCARLIGPRTRAIVPVHLYGHGCALEELLPLAARHGLLLLEDCAEALGSRRHGRALGSWGAAGTFSFYGNKMVTTGEGGAVVTDDDELAGRLRLLRGQGMDPARRYYHPVLGFNYRLSNLAAALGVAQLERLSELVARRRAVAAAYRRELRRLAGVTLQPEDAATVAWMVSVTLPSAELQQSIATHLASDGIETRPFFHPLHLLPMYTGCRNDLGCPVASDLAARGLTLPTYGQLGDGDVRHITDALARLLPDDESGDVQVAALCAGDAADLASFFTACAADADTTRFFFPHPLTAEQAQLLAAGGAQRRDRYYLARYRGRVVGYSMLRGWDEGYAVPSFGLCVHPQLRDARLGHLLFAHAAAESRRLGAARLRLTIDQLNERMAHLLRKLGWDVQPAADGRAVAHLQLDGAASAAPSPEPDLARLAAWRAQQP